MIYSFHLQLVFINHIIWLSKLDRGVTNDFPIITLLARPS